MAERGVNNALPKLPGYDFSRSREPATFAKGHGFDFARGQAGVPVVHPVVNQTITGAVGPSAGDARRTLAGLLPKFPQWKTLDNKVLRFFGFFTEPVPESPVEAERVRKVSLQFFLSDATVSVHDTPAVGNHGLVGGCLMARHAAPSCSLPTLRIGNVISLRGRDIVLVDCDAFTRDVFEVLAYPQPEPDDYPGDCFEESALKAKCATARDAEFMALKQSMELTVTMASGKMPTTMTLEERQRARQFIKGDKGILTFLATWEQRLFRVLYFLADNTICVNTVKNANEGRDPGTTFIKRARIPKGPLTLKSIDTVSAPKALSEFFEPSDFCTGGTLSIYGRDFFLYDCDEWTRAYYKDTFGREMPPAPRGATENDPPQLVRPVEVPPPTGFGSEEDSLASFKHIVPKAPRKDYSRYIEHANDVMRFSAVMAFPQSEDTDRQFIVCFYLADATVSVFEHVVRNSGHTGGKVCARTKMPGIGMADFVVGRELRLAGITYRLVSMDDRTKAFIDTGKPMGNGGSSKAEELLARVRLSLTQKYSRVTDAYRHFSGKTGISFVDLKRLFRECEVKVESEEVLAAVMQLADLDQDGVISLQEFVENVLRQSLAPLLPVATSTQTAAQYLGLQKEREQKAFADKVLKQFVAKLEARRAYIVDTFRIMSDRSVDGLIGVDTFRHVVAAKLGLNFTPEEMDALVYRFYYVEGIPEYTARRLSVREFRKVLDA